ncbi:MAG TPA: phosphatidate cytidylyltransferase [Bryobacteraceae bacterium]|nr:phosphatidate cytidylyltransferase [Bryobacteraceae bacterium]
MKRVLTALLLIPLFCYLIIWAPDWAFLAAVTAVALLCFREYTELAALHEIPKAGLFGYAAGVLLLFLPQADAAFLVLIAILAMALSLRSRELTEALPYAASVLLGVVYVFGTLRCGIDLRAINHYWLFFALSLNWVGDIAALYVGRTIGRHKMSPRISPAKSWEGAAASALASVIYGAVYIPRLLPSVPLVEALGLTAAANIAGQIGDLCESALKRGAGVKDSGTLLPGHGGWLDRVDSGLFALPVIYFIVRNFHW